jgi:hypothetical protein
MTFIIACFVYGTLRGIVRWTVRKLAAPRIETQSPNAETGKVAVVPKCVVTRLQRRQAKRHEAVHLALEGAKRRVNENPGSLMRTS